MGKQKLYIINNARFEEHPARSCEGCERPDITYKLSLPSQYSKCIPDQAVKCTAATDLLSSCSTVALRSALEADPLGF